MPLHCYDIEEGTLKESKDDILHPSDGIYLHLVLDCSWNSSLLSLCSRRTNGFFNGDDLEPGLSLLYLAGIPDINRCSRTLDQNRSQDAECFPYLSLA
jgi:hypothetical protein